MRLTGLGALLIPALAHSPVARCPEDVIDAEDEDLLSLVDILGELETLFKERGCNGEGGREFERRRAFLAEALIKSFDEACFRTGPGAGVLMASLRDFRAALITSVASIDLSFGDN